MKEEDDDDDDIPESTGQMFTHVACPLCDEEQYLEDDVRGQVVECTSCHGEFKIK